MNFFSKVLLAPICELVILYQTCSKGSDLHQAPHVCVIPWVSSELVQGLLSFVNMILLVMCISSGYKCLFIVYASCYKSCLVSHDVSIYCMMELRTSLHVSILHPRHHSSIWIIRVNLELSSLVLRNKSDPSFLVGDCTRSFL